MDQSTKDVGFFFVLMSITNEQIIPRLFPRIQDPNCVITLRCFILYFQKNSEGFDIAKHSNPKYTVSDNSKIIEILTYWVVFRKITLNFTHCNAI